MVISAAFAMARNPPTGRQTPTCGQYSSFTSSRSPAPWRHIVVLGRGRVQKNYRRELDRNRRCADPHETDARSRPRQDRLHQHQY